MATTNATTTGTWTDRAWAAMYALANRAADIIDRGDDTVDGLAYDAFTRANRAMDYLYARMERNAH